MCANLGKVVSGVASKKKLRQGEEDKQKKRERRDKDQKPLA